MEVIMSKRRRRTDYNKMSEFKEVEEVKDSAPEELVSVSYNDEPIEEPKMEIKNVVTLEKGKVANCEKLNVRMDASTEAPVATIIQKDSEVLIHPEQFKEGWHRIELEDGTSGFVMSDFIDKE